MKTFFYFLLWTSVVWSKPNGRIIGGQNATAGQFPFLAAIYATTPTSQNFCSGSLMNRVWILTAGQCVDGATSFIVHFAVIRLSEANFPVATESAVLHPDYNPQTLENDLGLIRLREEVSYGTYLHPISLPAVDIVPTSEGQACGWGQTSDSQAGLNDQLQYVVVTHVTDEECKVTYGGQIKENMACFEGSYNEGICFGDTGSPLVQRIGFAETILGVASFFSGNGCESTDPSGYTRVFPYVDWIEGVIAD